MNKEMFNYTFSIKTKLKKQKNIFMITLEIIIPILIILTILTGGAIYEFYSNKKQKNTNLEDYDELNDVDINDYDEPDYVVINYYNESSEKKENLIKYTESPDNTFPIITEPAKPGDACIDLVAQRIIEEDEWRIKYGTGIFVELPDEFHELQIRPRSSIYNYDLILANSPGTVDSGYRGEIMVGFKKTKKKGNFYKPGDRIAQFKIEFVPKVYLEKVENLTISDRGIGGFGSTGIKVDDIPQTPK